MEGGNSAEYRTLIHHTANLHSAVKSQLVSLGARLVSLDLIAPEKYDEFRLLCNPEVNRAADLVRLIQDKVKQNPRCYHTFIAALQEDQAQYGDIIRKLQDTYQPGIHMVAKCGRLLAICSVPYFYFIWYVYTFFLYWQISLFFCLY